MVFISSEMTAYFRVMLPIFGLFIGSFANVLIYRLPKGEEWVKTRSHCAKCGTEIKWYDLVPVFSYIVLRGRCRACGEKISPVYPAIELLNALLWTLCLGSMGLVPFLPVCLAAATTLVVIAAIDLKISEIPDGLQIFLLVIGILWNLYALAYGYNIWLDNLIGFFAASAILYILAVLSNGGMGGGDIKLMAVCGLIIGWERILLALGMASVIAAGLLIIPYILGKIKKGQHIPFGPFLAAGIFISMLYGRQIITLLLYR